MVPSIRRIVLAETFVEPLEQLESGDVERIVNKLEDIDDSEVAFSTV